MGLDVLTHPEEFRESLKSSEMRAAEDPRLRSILEDWDRQLDETGKIVATRDQDHTLRHIFALHGKFIPAGDVLLHCGEIVTLALDKSKEFDRPEKMK